MPVHVTRLASERLERYGFKFRKYLLGHVLQPGVQLDEGILQFTVVLLYVRIKEMMYSHAGLL